MSDPNSLIGHLLELDVGPVAHGGHCVARVGDDPRGRVVFVRHTLPGERVRALVTEDAGHAFCRADAVEIIRAAQDRVAAPCAHAGPGRCGGCDWQHAAPSAQRQLKAAVVVEQFARLAGLQISITVAPLAGGALGWRTRTTYAADGDGRLGLRRHRSHNVERVEHCPLGGPGVGDSEVLGRSWPGVSAVEVVTDSDDQRTILVHRPGPRRRDRDVRHRGRGRARDVIEVAQGPSRMHQRAAGHDFELAAGDFWQVHPRAAETFVAAVLDLLRPRPAESVLDLYAGAGLFTAPLAVAVGARGTVRGLEAGKQAVADAAGNLAALPWARVLHGQVTPAALARLGPVDVVVLDPPRAGAGREVMDSVVELARRAICYVACDPAALARDVRYALAAGWVLAELRAFDAFPMTHHVECIALLVPGN